MSRQEIKGNLARLLATENLIVEHRKTPTASFDVDRRVLTLPTWDRASSVVYDLLVGHEVGHALFTPNEDWRNVADCPKDYVNVIEDARIEKLMKRKYPGLRKSFATGYKELNDEDFFDIEDQDLDKFSLLDRINLHFKVGASAMIPFGASEMVFVERTENVETFEEVLQIAVDVYNFSKNEKEEEKAPEQMQPQQSTQGGGGSTQEGGEQQDNANDNANEENNANEDAPVGNQSSQKQEGGEEMGDEPGEEGSETQRAFDRSAESLSNRWGTNTRYVEIPESVNTSDYIVDWTELHDWIDEYREKYLADNSENPSWYQRQDFESVCGAYREFRKQSQKEVNYLVKEFECRKSADAYARAGQSKTGVLDTAKLHTYKYNEDLFKKVTVLPDGKNHGLLFLLDWSGSMQHEILATVKQLINLTSFCKKVQIPFEVYAFTNEWSIKKAMEEDTPYREDRFGEVFENEICLGKGGFHLMNFVSSRSNAKDYDRMCLNLFVEAYQYVHYTNYRATPAVGLSGTPLNEAVVMMNYIIPQFKKQNDLQKVNLCILSDGESCAISYGHKFYEDYKDEYRVSPRRIDHNVTLRDRKTGRVYEEFHGWYDATNVFIKQLRDRNPDVSVLGFRIMSGSSLKSFVSQYAKSSNENYEKVQRQWKKDRCSIIPEPIAFTSLYAISNNALDDTTDFNVESGAKKGEITRAFKKMLSNKSTNKKLLNSFVEHVA
jgi:hypothetical protein